MKPSLFDEQSTSFPSLLSDRQQRVSNCRLCSRPVHDPVVLGCCCKQLVCGECLSRQFPSQIQTELPFCRLCQQVMNPQLCYTVYPNDSIVEQTGLCYSPCRLGCGQLVNVFQPNKHYFKCSKQTLETPFFIHHYRFPRDFHRFWLCSQCARPVQDPVLLGCCNYLSCSKCLVRKVFHQTPCTLCDQLINPERCYTIYANDPMCRQQGLGWSPCRLGCGLLINVFSPNDHYSICSKQLGLKRARYMVHYWRFPQTPEDLVESVMQTYPGPDF